MVDHAPPGGVSDSRETQISLYLLDNPESFPIHSYCAIRPNSYMTQGTYYTSSLSPSI